jgi:hypothetical protein
MGTWKTFQIIIITDHDLIDTMYLFYMVPRSPCFHADQSYFNIVNSGPVGMLKSLGAEESQNPVNYGELSNYCIFPLFDYWPPVKK